MPEVIVYRSENASENRKCVGYVVLPNGEYWMVAFYGATEDEVKTKALKLWDRESARELVKLAEEANKASPDPWSTPAPMERQHHLAGKVWMIHKETREKKRIDLTEISLYEKNGFLRGGPRSK